MNKFSSESWAFYKDFDLRDGPVFVITPLIGKDYDHRAVCYDLEAAKLIQTAPEMYELLHKFIALHEASPLFSEAKRILARIDDES